MQTAIPLYRRQGCRGRFIPAGRGMKRRLPSIIAVNARIAVFAMTNAAPLPFIASAETVPLKASVSDFRSTFLGAMRLAVPRGSNV
jgi:hypothetical protein